MGMIHRPLLQAETGRNAKSNETRTSTQNDFSVGPFHRIPRRSLEGQMAFPCVFDVFHGRTWYALGLDPQELLNAPFANVYARTQTKNIVSVPWEAGPMNCPRVAADPIYVFSSGRCGSTLLHKILLAAKVASVSEPDIAAGLLFPAYREHRLIRPLIHRATGIFARDLMSALADADGTLLVKLRSQYCKAVPALMGNSRERRSIFMIRRFESWAKSVCQMFVVRPAYLLEMYQISLQCFAYLQQHGTCHLLRYEDLLERPHQEMTLLSEFLGREIPRTAVDEAMAVGSQTGTMLERIPKDGAAQWEAKKDEIYRLWNSSPAADLYDALVGDGSRA